MRILINKFNVSFKFSWLVITAIFALNACSGSNSSTTSQKSLYYGTSSGLIYNNNSLVISGSNALTPDGSGIVAIASENSITYFATNYGVYIESIGMWYLIGGASPTGIAGNINSMVVHENTIYIGGNDQNGNAVVYTESNSESWTLTPIIESMSQVTSIAFGGNQLYVAVKTDNGVCSVYIESGNIWSLVGESAFINNGNINSLVVNGNQVYVGGYNLNSESGIIYVESNGIWNSIGGTLLESSQTINSLAINNNILYAGGSTVNRDGVVYIESNGIWSILDGVIQNTYVNSLAVSGNQVYAG